MYAWRVVLYSGYGNTPRHDESTTTSEERNVIWNDERLTIGCLEGDLVRPFDPECINPASIDLRLGTSYRRPDKVWELRPGAWTLREIPPTWADEQHMPDCGIMLMPGEFILCCSLETVHLPANCCGILYSKSSTGRRGLEHMHAGYIDPGFQGQLTFEFHNVAPWPIRLEPNQRVMQMCVDQMIAPAMRNYALTGRYQNQVGATPAREAR